MEEKILSICIPTYNRKKVLIDDLNKYLSIDDKRFYIKINDNASTDGTDKEINLLNNERIIYNRNNENKGQLYNAIKSLSGAPSKYVIFIIDKDLIDTNVLPIFIDFLEKESPDYGYVDLTNDKPISVKNYKAGLEAILNTAYKSKHASGFFAKTVLLQNEIEKKDIQELSPSFGFLFDLIAGSLGAKNNASVVYMPLIINANLRPKDNINLSKSYTYNEDNFFFGKKMRIQEYKYYINNILNIEINSKEKIILTNHLTNLFSYHVSLGVKDVYRNRHVCSHYNLKYREVSFLEMMNNIIDLMEIYRSLCNPLIPSLNLNWEILINLLKGIIRIFKSFIKELFKPFKEQKISA